MTSGPRQNAMQKLREDGSDTLVSHSKRSSDVTPASRSGGIRAFASRLCRHGLMVAVIAFAGSANAATSPELAQYERALRVISEFADRFCKDVPLAGERNSAAASAEAQARVNGLLKRLTEIGGSLGGTVGTESFRGLLREDLLAALQDTNKCRLQVWADLRDRLLLPPSSRGESAGPPFPLRDVQLVVAFPPGGSTDLVSRLLAQKLTEVWRRPVRVTNRVGGTGVVALATTASAAADGHTLVAITSSVAIDQVVQAPPYDIGRNLVPVVAIATSPYVITSAQGTGANNVAQFLQWSRSRDVRYASSSHAGRLAVELFKSAVGFNGTHVTLSGAQALTDLVAGNLDIIAASPIVVVTHVNAGRLRAIALTSSVRHSVVPQVPTSVEQGYPDLVMENWIGLLAPIGTPSILVTKISTDLSHVMRESEFVQQLASNGLTPIGGTSSQFERLLNGDLTRARELASRGMFR